MDPVLYFLFIFLFARSFWHGQEGGQQEEFDEEKTKWVRGRGRKRQSRTRSTGPGKSGRRDGTGRAGPGGEAEERGGHDRSRCSEIFWCAPSPPAPFPRKNLANLTSPASLPPDAGPERSEHTRGETVRIGPAGNRGGEPEMVHNNRVGQRQGHQGKRRKEGQGGVVVWQ